MSDCVSLLKKPWIMKSKIIQHNMVDAILDKCPGNEFIHTISPLIISMVCVCGHCLIYVCLFGISRLRNDTICRWDVNNDGMCVSN